ncbi:BCCT family transporter [Microbulbifer hydrolyticus]|uniref:BCCT family transporter n=1 Tax=Microbulbifer hydrolyticus TaxID=48074 RepID=A0A6P1TA18_9GAMM|nr:choline BCCT transporter BetT [Microbulbifer hydrolyticus]MBB5212737.1 choline/glycine/proline betaine transport protein [Microbulbifer hydrolyticus]QHQ38456.1 BCCT family transporter [Microbulbifer hydrolyticus]
MTDSSDNSNQQPAHFNPPVFYSATAVLLLMVAYAVLAPDNATSTFQSLQEWVVTHMSWYYVLTVAIILIGTIAIAMSSFGEIKMGPEHAEPDYDFVSWFAMLFSAGMGIGLLFFGVAEPVMHYLEPPVGETGTVYAAEEAMVLTFFHWGFHAWAIYAIVALILAYFSYRHKLPLTLRSALYPMIGERIYGPIGHAVDVFAIVGTVCGVATTLGYGVLQINSGLNHLFGLPVGPTVQVVLIIVTTILATISVVLGLDAGIKRLSQLNMTLAAILLIMVLLLGSTIYLLQAFVQNFGTYLSQIVDKTFDLFAYAPTDWLGGWTILYWGWWMSWSPFVGLFIARISRGRTIREFVVGAMLVPALVTMLWMTFFGNSAIHMILDQGLTELGEIVAKDQSVALFQFLEQFPFSSVFSFVAVLMVIVFFVTSADSGALVVNMLSSHGRDDTPLWQRIFWCFLIGTVAVALLLAGGLGSLQTAVIASALPFSAILLISMYGLVKALRTDTTKRITQSAVVAPISARNPVVWQRRLKNALQLPSLAEVHEYIRDIGQPALDEFAEEMRKNGYETTVKEKGDQWIQLEVSHGEEVEFIYGIYPKATMKPDASHPEKELNDTYDDGSPDTYFRAEVHLYEGGQDYDVMGWTKEQLLTDMVTQYERHLQFLHTLR